MSKPTIITFKESWRGYGPGETAGFDDATAQALIDAGRADAYSAKKSKRASPAAASANSSATAVTDTTGTVDASGSDAGTGDQDEDGGKP